MTRPIHFEILCEDPHKVVTFYEKALGWQISTWEGGEAAYWLATTGPDEKPGINGAFMGRNFQQAVINTIEIASLDETIKKVESAGGRLVHGPTEIPGVGTHAYCADPEGNLFGLMQPAAEMG